MKTTVNWLRDYVDVDLAPDEIARRLIAIGFDVEDVVAAGDDVCLVVDVPSNRPDCLGALGLARELAAAVGRPLRVPEPRLIEDGPGIVGDIDVAVESAADCPRYTARLIRGVRVGPSPDWLRNRLTAVGLAPVNNIVDITNYVLFECGQPLHAFDAARLRGRRIGVRRGRLGEKIIVLNGRECAVGPEALVIADADGPVAIAGVMGGKASEITSGTRDVLLESAQFDPVTVRRGSRRLGLDSESSYRFERGVAFDGVAWASRRASALMGEIAGGKPAPGCIDVSGARPAARSIRLRRARCERLLGMPCDGGAVADLLRAIGCEVRSAGPAAPDAWEAAVPAHRGDLQREEDLIEEVARLQGYDRIPTTPQVALVLADKDRTGAVEARLRERLVAMGYQEVLTPSFGEASAAGELRLEEDLQPVLALGKRGTPDRPLRMSLAASLLGVLRTNDRYGVALPQVFEVAAVYGCRADGGAAERTGLGLAVRGDYRALRGHVESLAAALGARLAFVPWERPPAGWPDGGTAALLWKGKRIGAVAELDAAAARRLDLQHGAAVAEIDLTDWFEKACLRQPYRDVSRLPEAVRDVALVVDAGMTWDRLEAVVRAAAPPWMERLEAFDVYRGAQVPDGRKSIAFTLTFRRPDRTLTRAEVDAALQEIVRRLERDLGGRLRA